MQIVITDLTRFAQGNPNVCTAGVAEDGTVIRPMPYLTAEFCRKLDIHPGSILIGDFAFHNSSQPHVEDAGHKNLTFAGPCSKEDFRLALDRTLYSNLSEGFGVQIKSREKCIPTDTPPIRSLITIKVRASTFSVVQNQYDNTKLRAHLSDSDGVELSFVSVTDRGFYDYAQQHANDLNSFAEINRFIQTQDELYLRIGLSRSYRADDGRNGYWIQLNGIYTFPDKLDYIRCYD